MKKIKSRTSLRLTPTTKRILSQLSVEHLDGFSKQHELDIKKQREWAAKHFGKVVTEDISKQQLLDALEEAGLVPAKKDDWIERTDLEELETFRENLCFENGRWVSKTGKEWIEFINGHKSARSEYTEQNGNIRKRSDPPREVTRKDKDGKEKKIMVRDYQEPLLSTFVRMPPWLAQELDEAKDEQLVKEVITRFAEYYAKQTGMDILAVNIHRESSHDLHIHLVCSDVIKHTKVKKVSVRERAKLMKPLREQAKAEMKKQGLPAQPARVKEYMEENGFTVPETQDVTEFRKIIMFEKGGSKSRKKDWPVARRDMHVLGTAYRNKAWLYESATEGDKEKIGKFREVERQGNFHDQFMSRKDPKADFVDWWAENELFDRLLAGLSSERQKLVKANADKAVEKYLQYGKSVLDPAEIALADEKSAAEAEKKAIAEDQSKLEADQEKLEAEKKAVAKDKSSSTALNKEATAKLSEADSKLKEAELIESANTKVKAELEAAQAALAGSRKTTADKIRSARSKFRGERFDAVARLLGVKLSRKPGEDSKTYRLRIRNVAKAREKRLAALAKAGKAIKSSGDFRKDLPKEMLQTKGVSDWLKLIRFIEELLGIENVKPAPVKGKGKDDAPGSK